LQQTSLLEGARRLLNILVEGYTTLNRRLWVLVIPIGLDLYLWLGPGVSLRGLIESLVAFSQQVAQANPQQATAALQLTDQPDLVGLISSPLLAVLIPRLAHPARPGYAVPAWVPPSPLLLVLAGLAAAALVVLFWSLYLLPLADLVRGSNESGLAMLRRVPGTWARMILYCGMVVVGGFLLLLGVILVAALAQAAGGGLAVLVLALAGALVVWVLLFLFMAPSAILLSGVGPLRAVSYSVQAARTRLWSTMGFFLLTTMVQAGTASLWERLSGQPVWVLVGIIANGYVVGGLAAAGLIFFRENLRDWLGRQNKA
jgi:hypothetical protein